MSEPCQHYDREEIDVTTSKKVIKCKNCPAILTKETKSADQAIEQLKMMYRGRAGMNNYTKEAQITDGWIAALKWFLNDES